MPTFSLKPICSYLDRNKISLKSLEFCQWSYIILFVVIQLIRHININDCIHYIVCIIIYIYYIYIQYSIYIYIYIYIQYIELYRDIDIDIDIDIDSDIDISTINLPQLFILQPHFCRAFTLPKVLQRRTAAAKAGKLSRPFTWQA